MYHATRVVTLAVAALAIQGCAAQSAHEVHQQVQGVALDLKDAIHGEARAGRDVTLARIFDLSKEIEQNGSKKIDAIEGRQVTIEQGMRFSGVKEWAILAYIVLVHIHKLLSQLISARRSADANLRKRLHQRLPPRQTDC